jgi:uroporphyrinogen decarboxylase
MEPREMNTRERLLAVLNYDSYDRMPVLHFGYWRELLQKWAIEGHISQSMADGWSDGNEIDEEIDQILGWDHDFAGASFFSPNSYLDPEFESEVLKEFPDGSKYIRDNLGITVLYTPDNISIPTEIEHLLTDISSWKKYYKDRYQWNEDRILNAKVKVAPRKYRLYKEGGRMFMSKNERNFPYSLWAGSIIGHLRNVVGIVNLSYLQIDDPVLLKEMMETINDLSYQNVKYTLEAGFRPDITHFWEDICFRSGPLVSPDFFAEHCVPAYKRITDLLKKNGCSLVSVDCDGLIDELVPLWLEGGVNIMFPIEVGVWDAKITPWREKYGRELRGIGAMNKHAVCKDRAAVDMEIERLKEQVALGGFIPCPDHRLPPESKWNLVRYYTDKFRETF